MALFPFRKPITDATECLVGISMHISHYPTGPLRDFPSQLGYAILITRFFPSTRIGYPRLPKEAGHGAKLPGRCRAADVKVPISLKSRRRVK
jgi:hypothetical protein